MTPQTPKQLGICSWSLHSKNPQDLIDGIKAIGLKKVQLALNPLYYDPDTWADTQSQLKNNGITIVSGMFGTIGENYSTLETIRKTGGIVPDKTWEENWQLIQAVAKITADMKLDKVSFHAGFIPDDHNDPTVPTLTQRIRQIADLFAKSNTHIILETGQETADALWAFLDNADRDNLGINFDPANMILYDKGDPIEALKKLLPRVKQVHIKDAEPNDQPNERGRWGREVPIGDGKVDWPAFITVLAEGDFTGDMVIEREAGDQRIKDISTAVQRITAVMKALNC